MSSFLFGQITSALLDASKEPSGVDFTGEARKLDTEADAKPIVEAISTCERLEFLNLTGNTLGVEAAIAIADALKAKPEFQIARWSDMFTGRMKTEIPKALTALGDGMIQAGARLTVLDLSDNAFGPIGVEGLANLIVSAVCDNLQELRLNNNGLGITGGRLLSKALLRGGGSRIPHLKVFIAGRNRLEDDGAIALSEVFKAMGTLEEVAMPQNGIYHKGITALAEAFKLNKNLKILNLNDNTIGPKGAAAIAAALPQLKALREINFGDCLLESAGADKLAEGIKTAGLQLEVLDLSHNEIKSAACSAVASALSLSAPGVLRRVVLAGNSLGNAATRRKIKDSLGDSAVLKDEDEETDDDGDDDSDAGSDEETDDANSTANSAIVNNSAASEKSDVNGDSQHQVFNFGVPQPILDLSTEESVTVVETSASKFLEDPTLENFKSLGTNAATVLEEHINVIKDPGELVEAHVSAIMKISSLVSGSSETDDAKQAAIELYKTVASRGGHGSRWLLGNSMLVSLGLLKSEKKVAPPKYVQNGCLSVLSAVINEKWFPDSLRDTIKFFIQNRIESSGKESTVDYSQYSGLC